LEKALGTQIEKAKAGYGTSVDAPAAEGNHGSILFFYKGLVMLML
jgi:hypothetical protein